MNPLLPAVALVSAVLGMLAVFAVMLLAPAVRSRLAREPEDDDATLDTVLFARPVATRRRGGLPPPRPDAERPLAVLGAPVAAPVAAPAEVELRGAPVDPATRSRRAAVADVLVVTADEALSRSQLGVLASGGYSSRCASCASDAIGAIRARVPDLLLVDAAGPTEAKRVVRAVRSGPGARVPVVVLTSVDDGRAMRRRAAELDVTDIVVDPLSIPRQVERALPYWLAGVSVFTTTRR